MIETEIKSRDKRITSETLNRQLQSGKCIIVLDTNVLLNVYRYSPEFSEFALACLKAVQNNIYLPSTVYLEYNKHFRGEFSKMGKRVETIGNETEQQIEKSKNEILASCEQIRRLQYDGVDELKENLDDHLIEMHNIVSSFFKDRKSLIRLSMAWNGTDLLYEFIQELKKNGQIMPDLSHAELDAWCTDGEKRYKKSIPPGFKDAKSKDGMRKYSDLFVWNEILRWAKQKKIDILFVTDDVKSDWWKNRSNGEFHPELIQEFNKTRQAILPYQSYDFYQLVSQMSGIELSDATELSLSMTDEEYFQDVEERVFDEICDQLNSTLEDYIDEMESHIGSAGLDEVSIVEHEFIHAERIDRDGEYVWYDFAFHVKAEGTSSDYWGYDREDRETIYSPSIDHVFEGDIHVEVTRKVNVFLDFEGDGSYEEVKLASEDGCLKEISFRDHMDDEIPQDKAGPFGICPDCGRPITYENRGRSGFCTECEERNEH